MSYKLIDNENEHQYEFHTDEGIPFIEYIKTPDKLTFLTYTKVPSNLEGQGIGSALVEACLGQIKNEGRKVVPQCPFVASYIKKHPEWINLIMR